LIENRLKKYSANKACVWDTPVPGKRQFMKTAKYPPPCWALFETQVITVEPGHARLRFVPSESHENPYGIIQGGLLVAMLDNCLGPAMVALYPTRQVATIEIKTNFLSPARSGDVLIAEATVIRHGRSTAYLEASLSKEDGTLVCRASATNLVMGEATRLHADDLGDVRKD
jgi:uncharacterized protein (TIGR00369 family)